MKSAVPAHRPSITGANRVKPTVMAYSIKDREAKPVAEDVTDWSATADGKHVLAEVARRISSISRSARAMSARSFRLAGLATTRVPAEEWREIFAEVWRRYRDYFYVENMHGFDWNKLRAQYEPLLADVGHRADLNYVIGEMIAELDRAACLHRGRRFGLPKRPFVALPGARFELDAKSRPLPHRQDLRRRERGGALSLAAHRGRRRCAVSATTCSPSTDASSRPAPTLTNCCRRRPISRWSGASPRRRGRPAARTIRYRPLRYRDRPAVSGLGRGQSRARRSHEPRPLGLHPHARHG